MLHLQQTAGNQAVARLLQAGLQINQPGEAHEQEADRAAEQVMRGPEPKVQQKPVAGEGHEPSKFKQPPVKGRNSVPATLVETGGARSSGHPMSNDDRNSFEARLGKDFSEVRLHTDAVAAELARAMQARAFTLGQDVVLGEGEYAPGTVQGRTLLAHELAHTLQQKHATGPQAIQRKPLGKKKAGIGSKAPAEPFIRAEGTGAEDGHALFAQDSASLGPEARKKIMEMLAPQKEAVTVDIHGYASEEGDKEYNLNLSAHRAVAVKAFLKDLLPAGSKINVFARGETKEFGTAAQNRRVGIDITPGVTASGFSLKMRKDPGPQQPSTGVGGPQLKLEPPPAIPAAPTPEPALTPVPPVKPSATPDWSSLREPFTSHGLRLTDRDLNEIEEHWRRSFELFRGVLPADKAALAASKATAFAYDKQLSLEQPNVLDDLRERDRRLGLPDPILTIPILTPDSIDWGIGKAKKLFGK